MSNEENYNEKNYDQETIAPQIQALTEQGVSGSLVIDGALHLLVIPPQVIARITTEPRLLPIQIQLQLDPGRTLNGEIDYSAFIEYTEHNRNDRTATVTGRSASLSFTINFGDVVQGGRFQITAKVP